MRRLHACSLLVGVALIALSLPTVLAAPPDDDSDGVRNQIDNCPQTYNPGQSDLDSDGVGDVCDICPEHANPGQQDIDSDGVGNHCDLCPYVYDPEQPDADSDELGDVCDPDDDNDGVDDPYDNCYLVPNADQSDVDSDGAGDACDVDDDNDGVDDIYDNCQFVPNADQNDLDSDGSGDACDTDVDGDGVLNQHDNCPTTYNPDRADADSDDLGDACDPCPSDAANDGDSDGLCGDVDNCPAAFNPAQGDSDSDAIGDACDTCPADPVLDSDSDGVCASDNCPLTANPGQADGDSDGAGDACDNCPGLFNDDQQDTDFDGQGDACDTDDDDDGIEDAADNCQLVPNPGQEDTDSDGNGDSCDPCPSSVGSGYDSDSDGYCDADDSCPSQFNPMQGTVRLHGQLYHDHDVNAFRISPDSSRIVFTSDLNVDDRMELSASDALDGASRILNPALPADGDVMDNFDITPDSQVVLFAADIVDDESFEIYRSSIAFGGTSVLLSDRPLFKDEFYDYRYMHLRPDGQTVHYIAGNVPHYGGPWWWWSVPVAGGPSTKIVGGLPATAGKFSDDSLHFLYEADDGPTVLYVADTTTLLADNLWTSNWLILQDWEIVEEASRVLYWGVEWSAWAIHPLISQLLTGEGSVMLETCSSSPEVASVPAAGEIRVVFRARSAGDLKPCDGPTLGWFSDRIDGGDRRFLTDDATYSVGRMRIAPDGQSAFYITYDDLRRIDILGGTPETIHTPVTSFKFSPDGSWIVFLSDGSLYKVPLNGTETTLIGVSSEEYEISPDSSTILYRTADERELWAVSMNGGQPQRLTSELVAGGTLGMGRFSPDSSYVVYWAQQHHAARTELYRVAIELDGDGDSRPAACDLAPEDPASWSPPSEVRDLLLSRTGSVAHLSWSVPESLGGLTVSYRILRSDDPAAFRAGSTQTIDCLPDGNPDDLSGEDGDIPAAAFYYLIRADHGLKGMVGPERERAGTWSCP